LHLGSEKCEEENGKRERGVAVSIKSGALVIPLGWTRFDLQMVKRVYYGSVARAIIIVSCLLIETRMQYYMLRSHESLNALMRMKLRYEMLYDPDEDVMRIAKDCISSCFFLLCPLLGPIF